MAKTAIIFGSSGLIGSNLVKELIKNPAYNKIFLFVRKPLVIVNDKVQEIQLGELDNYDFSEVSLPECHVFCCIGTTIKTAGSKEEFRRVDYELPLQFATWAKKMEIPLFAAVSSIGANTSSGNFYLRTKGEMEEGLKAMQFKRLIIVRPSLLLGTRNEFRMGEELAKMFSGIMNIILHGPFKKYRPIKAVTVARAMISLAGSQSSETVYESDQLQELGG